MASLCAVIGHDLERIGQTAEGDQIYLCRRCEMQLMSLALSDVEVAKIRATFEELEKAYRDGNLPF
jgi:hypothetical protein